MHWNEKSRGWESRDSAISIESGFFRPNETVLSKIVSVIKDDEIHIKNTGEGLVQRKRKFVVESRSGKETVVKRAGEKSARLSNLTKKLDISYDEEKISIKENGKEIDLITYQIPSTILEVYTKSIGISLNSENIACLQVELAKWKDGTRIGNYSLDLMKDRNEFFI